MTKKKPIDNQELIDKHCLDRLSIEENEILKSLVAQNPKALQTLREQQFTLEKYLNSTKRESPQINKQIILDRLQDIILDDLELNEQGQLSEFIQLSNYSNPSKWQQLTQSLSPPDHYKNIHIHTLFASKKKQLYLLWVKNHIPKEIHPELDERFLILNGSCTYTEKEETITLRSGQLKKVSPQSNHQLNVISKKPVKAILSRTLIS